MRAELRTDLRVGLATILAMLLTLGSVLLLAGALGAPSLGVAVLGVTLAVTLSRSQLERDLRGRLEAGVVLPLLSVVTAGVAELLHVLPWVGAAVFVAAVTGSVLLRIPGGMWRRIGRLVVLPFTTLLIARPVHTDRFGPVGAVLVPLVVGVVAWGWVTAVQVLGQRAGLLPTTAAAASTPVAPAVAASTPVAPAVAASAPVAPAAASAPVGVAAASAPAPAPDRPRRGSLRPSASVRFAIQTAVSLSAAFVVGYLVFPERWAWIVLTAFIVGAGARSRADTVQRAVHRFLGSGLGTVVALLPLGLLVVSPRAAVVVALLAVSVGVVLRPRAYLWWAFSITIALAITQRLAGGPQPLLLDRWEEIGIGAVIGVLPAWFLLPVRAADTARARIRDVLAALHDRLVAPEDPRAAAALDASVGELRRATAALAELGRLTRGRVGDAARWVALTEECAELGADGSAPGARRALGEARRALREPHELTGALTRLRDVLASR